MNEHFLSFIWKFSYYNTTNLTTTDGLPLIIQSVGYQNHNSGPDFEDVQINLEGLVWKGKAELHVKSSDWDEHNHQKDKSFNTVVLHVVWEHNKNVKREDGTLIPTLELRDIVNKDLLERYTTLFSEKQFIPCEQNFHKVKRITKLSFLDALMTRRLQRKGKAVLVNYKNTKDNWRETTYRQIASVFGLKVNKEAFEKLATTLPYKVVQKHKGHLFQIEALLFGMAGFLEGDAEEYQLELKKEYIFLSKKYQLPQSLELQEWRFSRMRPNAFPTVRLAKFAALLNQNSDVFLKAIDIKEIEEVNAWMEVEPSDYWNNHHHFGKSSSYKKSSKILSSNLIINAIVPLKVAYAIQKEQNTYLEEAIVLLEKMKIENNAIIRNWKGLSLPIMNAFDSQASLELHNEYCLKKRCLNCAIGVELIKSKG